MLNAVFHVCVVFFIINYVWSMRKTFAVKPSSRNLESLKGKTLYRFTSELVLMNNNEVQLIPTPGLIANLSARCQPVTWFFVGEPSEWQKAANNISSYEIQLKIPFNQLDENCVLYRRYDNVVGYTKKFTGTVEVVRSSNTKSLMYKLFKLWENIKAGAELLLFTLALIFLFGNIGYLLFALFAAFIFSLSFIDKLNKRKIRKMSKNS
ncbi:hypothetical protein [Paenibacillus sp. FSL H3-0333]|uniref:hypothetical protein n=1 Tax=Paenibacillus sp. FSL H3-0333 TaxID=2921373 RepID=UPI0030F82550